MALFHTGKITKDSEIATHPRPRAAYPLPYQELLEAAARAIKNPVRPQYKDKSALALPKLTPVQGLVWTDGSRIEAYVQGMPALRTTSPEPPSIDSLFDHRGHSIRGALRNKPVFEPYKTLITRTPAGYEVNGSAIVLDGVVLNTEHPFKSRIIGQRQLRRVPVARTLSPTPSTGLGVLQEDLTRTLYEVVAKKQ